MGSRRNDLDGWKAMSWASDQTMRQSGGVPGRLLGACADDVAGVRTVGTGVMLEASGSSKYLI
jgi:hypothetical protein